jgi:hypothetical protein
MAFQLTLVGRLRTMAGLVTVAVLGVAGYTGFAYYEASVDQRLSTTRAVVGQSLAIAKKYHDEETSGKLPAAGRGPRRPPRSWRYATRARNTSGSTTWCRAWSRTRSSRT